MSAIYALGVTEQGLRCEKCFRLSEKLSQCSNCKSVKYCSKDCQKNDWWIHKTQCKGLLRIQPTQLQDFEMMFFKVVAFYKMDKCAHKFDGFHGMPRRCFKDLMLHHDAVLADDRKMKEFHALQSNIKIFMKGSDVPTVPELLDIFGKIVVNTFGVFDLQLRRLGSILDIRGSALNHSCRPNTYHYFEGTQLRLYHPEKLTPGEEMTISYIELSDRSDRRKQLQSLYFFHCECSMCLDDEMDARMNSVLSQDEQLVDELVSECQAIEGYAGESGERDELRKYSRAKQLVQKADGVLDPYNIHYLKVKTTALDAAVYDNDWERAIDLATEILPPYRLYFGAKHLVTANILAKLGKIQVYLGRLREAVDCLEQVLHGTILVSVQCEENSENGKYLQHIRDLLSQAKLELQQQH